MSVLHGQGLTRSGPFADVFKELAMAFKEFKEKGQRLDFIAHLYCKHGQNRSVGTATLMIEAPLSIKYVVLLVLLPRTWYIHIYICTQQRNICWPTASPFAARPSSLCKSSDYPCSLS